jgi:integrase
LSAAKRVPATYGSLLTTLALTGMRLGEGLGLQWDDVDVEHREIRVQRTLSHGLITTPTSGHSRRVAIGPELTKLLLCLVCVRAEQAKRYQWSELPPWVFATAAGGPPDVTRLRKHFGRCLEAAGSPQTFTPHSLRHTFASLVARQRREPDVGATAAWSRE